MLFKETKLEGAYIIDIELISDQRGFFGRNWCAEEFERYGLRNDLKQANISFNFKKGTLRGMHFQFHPYQETKLVRCTKGKIYDVIVDLRPDSDTFKQWIGVELSEDNYKILYVPEYFAHGYLTLEDNCEVMYFVTQFYTPTAEGGIRWNEQQFNIDWPIEPFIISEKDNNHPDFEN